MTGRDAIDATPHCRATPAMSGVGRIWLLNVAMTGVGALLYALVVRDLGPAPGPIRLPWIAVTLAFCAAEVAIITVRFRGQNSSFSLCELVIVPGLLFVPPGQLVPAVVFGGVLSLLCRRLEPIKAAFNLAQWALEITVTAALFHLLRPGVPDPALPKTWLAVVAAMVAWMALSTVALSAAVSIANGERWRLRAVWSEFMGIVVIANTALALLGVMTAWHSPAGLWLLLIPTVTVGASYRAYAHHRQAHLALDSLNTAIRLFHRSPDLEGGLVAVMDHALEIFHASRAEILLFPRVAGEMAFRTALGPNRELVVMEPVDDRDAPAAWHRATGFEGSRLVADGEHVPYPVSDARDAMIVALQGETRVVGVMVVADRTAEVGTFTDPDLRLLETLASHISVTLEKGQLEQSLAQLRALQDQLTHQAFHDSLTTLANRALFADRVQHALARRARSGGRLAVLFIDLDDFKTINDSLGHAAGDELLMLVAERLRGMLRPADTAARLGGDEFAILLEDLDHDDDATPVADRLIAAMREPFEVESSQVQIDASIGIAIAADGDTVDEVLSNADVAMYAAKADGKGRAQVFESAMKAQVLKRHEITAALQLAIDRDEMTLHYQPVVELASGDIVGVEALLRWEHPDRGMVSPVDFVPVAEETGQIVPIGRWVLQEACAQVRRWSEEVASARRLFMTVNLSPRQLSQPDLIDQVRDALAGTGLEPHRLVLEITESVVMHRTEETLRVIEGLRALGVRVAMDDFGTGYSSLSYLQWLPIDLMKIAKPFVDALGSEEDKAAVTEAMVSLGHTLELRIVAEGIETAEQLDRLRALGCDYGQGFHMHRPLTAAAFLATLKGVRRTTPPQVEPAPEPQT